MTPQGADRAGSLLAITALMGASLFGLAALLFAARGLL